MEMMGWTVHLPLVEKALFFAEALLDPQSPQTEVPAGSFVPRIPLVDFLVRPAFEPDRLVPYLDRTETRPAFASGERVALQADLPLQKLSMKDTEWDQNGRQVKLMTGGRTREMVRSKRLGKLETGDARVWRGEDGGTNSSKQRQEARKEIQLISCASYILQEFLYNYSSMGHYWSHTEHLHIYSEITERRGGKPTQSQKTL